MKSLVVLTSVFAVLLAAQDARAGCTFSSSTLPLGSYDVFSSTPTDSLGTLTYNCSGTSAPLITLSAGNSGSYASRSLRFGSRVLSYNLYLDAARTEVWGDGTGGTSTYTGSVGAVVNVPVYGRIPAMQTSVTAGLYTDSILATINF